MHDQWATLFHTRFLLGTHLLPNRFLDPMAASIIGHLVLQSMSDLRDDGCLIKLVFTLQLE
jgi:hypothetical protein